MTLFTLHRCSVASLCRSPGMLCNVAGLPDKVVVLPDIGEGLPDKVEEQIQDSTHEGLNNWVELDRDVNDVLQALGACLIQPGIHLSPLLVIRECTDVCHLPQPIHL